MKLHERVLVLSRDERRLFKTTYSSLHVAEVYPGTIFDELAAAQKASDEHAAYAAADCFDTTLIWEGRSNKKRRDLFVPIAAAVLFYEIERDLDIPVEPTDEVTYGL